MNLDLAIQLIGIIFVSVSGYRLKALTISGSIATVLVGFAVSVGFSYEGLVLLGLFFITSSLWSKFKRNRKENIKNKVQKGEQRDYVQVLANGGVPAMAGILSLLYPNELWLYMFIAAVATANADTWASEIGPLSKNKPVLITKLSRVDAGTSGAVSLLGTFAALVGALLIVVVAYILWPILSLQAVITLGFIGFIGNFLDTILGAVLQVSYRCKSCGIETEKTAHCGQETLYYKGIRLFNNDFINFTSIIIAATIGGLLLYYF